MTSRSMSSTAWKIMISILAALALVQVTIEAIHAFPPAVQTGMVGSLKVATTDNGGLDTPYTIDQLEPDSPLLAVGAAVGDRILFDPRPELFVHMRLPGETVGLTLLGKEQPRHVVVTAVAQPMTVPFRFGLISDLVVSSIAAIFAVMIAFKRGDLRAYRALTLFFLIQGFNSGFNFTPPSMLKLVADLLSWGLLNLGACCCVIFALYYPDDQPAGLRARLIRWLPAFYTITALAVFYSVRHLLMRMDAFLDAGASLYWGLCTLITLLALWDGWRSSVGAIRQRYAWLLGCIGTAALFTFLHNTQQFIATVPGLAPLKPAIFPLYEVALLSMEIGIAYAILKLRVFNFGFAINRTIFYTLSSVLMLVTFGIIEWLAEHLLKFEDREASVLLDGAIALSVYLAFHKIRHLFEHWLERMFFHRWHANEAHLRHFIKHAAHITTLPALLATAREELQRFSAGAHCTVYLRQEDGNYRNATATADVAGQMDANDRLCIALRAEQTGLYVDEQNPAFAGGLALPLMHRRELDGFVLLGAKPNGEEYRPDEVAVLSFAAHEIGLDLYALRNEMLADERHRHVQRIELDAVRIEEQQCTIAHLQQALTHNAVAS